MSATSPLSRPATPQERAAMMRAMLADRVKLVTHVETRQFVPSKAEREVLVIDRLERPTET